jgi:hypothetical protein
VNVRLIVSFQRSFTRRKRRPRGKSRTTRTMAHPGVRSTERW